MPIFIVKLQKYTFENMVMAVDAPNAHSAEYRANKHANGQEDWKKSILSQSVVERTYLPMWVGRVDRVLTPPIKYSVYWATTPQDTAICHKQTDDLQEARIYASGVRILVDGSHGYIEEAVDIEYDGIEYEWNTKILYQWELP